MANAEETALPATAVSPSPVSFSFSRTSSRRRMVDLEHSKRTAPEEKDFLSTVEERELQSVKPSEGAKELVIPLIQNRHHRQLLTKAPGPSTGAEALADEALADEALLSQAAEELIEESRKTLEERENENVNATLTIPMIPKEGNSSGEGAGSKLQAETVPEEADYETVPVEAYGLAMLRGMGWKPGQGIGRTFNQVVKPRVSALRPKGLGLGANLTEAQALACTAPHRVPKPDEEQEKLKEGEPQGLVPGRAVVVRSGPHRGIYGKVEGLDPDNARAMVRLAVGNQVVTISEYCLLPVSQQEFDKNLHLSQVRKTSSEQQNGTASSLKALQERKRKRPPDQQDGFTVKSAKASPKKQHWLRRDLRVRFVDKLHKGGQYYNTKMIIEDVLSPDTCVCRTDENQILEDLREDMLETLIPKVRGERVMVVLGPQAGRVGQLIDWDTERNRALVRLQRENQLVELHYDAVCQYMGPSNSDED
ncbi:PREDICTED: G patch domain and KOW motifs-containing protein-like [Elephantulus edwardii]|uniref:G patch domain and KOW motifs-containing protein-like n=1 Tax=Elephantulus edwardii TaxID=28737 RepID=UPI0003F0CA84|nr:PREDICTED: G patch domain and KOW motifs-containing protein-like [Elephantulus edwardii]